MSSNSAQARCTLCNIMCQWLAAGRWSSPGPPVSSTNITDRHDINEILLKMALITVTLTQYFLLIYYHIAWIKHIGANSVKHSNKEHPGNKTCLFVQVSFICLVRAQWFHGGYWSIANRVYVHCILKYEKCIYHTACEWIKCIYHTACEWIKCIYHTACEWINCIYHTACEWIKCIYHTACEWIKYIYHTACEWIKCSIGVYENVFNKNVDIKLSAHGITQERLWSPII